MTIATTAALWQTLDSLELLDASTPGAARQLLEKQITDPRALARQLVHNGWLTTYQVNQLFQQHAQSLVLGGYVLLEPLGEGGMGQVFKARQRPFNRTVALKIVRKDRLKKRDAIKRFVREIQLAAQLVHPHIVTAFDADKVDDTYFYVMEYVNGSNLGRRVRQHGPLPVLHACEYMRQTALGLQHAHERHIVHRDIKPANILVAPRTPERPLGTVKILDMGLARLIEEGEEAELTREGSVLGTVDFLSPEQALNSHAADIRSDLYSLGCTFYFILSGHVPYQGGQATEKLLRHRLEEAQPIEAIRPDARPTSAIVRKLMAKNPAERFQTPAELAHELLACIHSLGGDPPVPRLSLMYGAHERSTPDELRGNSKATIKIPALKMHLPRVGGWSLSNFGAIWKKRPALPRRGRRFWYSCGGALAAAFILAGVLLSLPSADHPDKKATAAPPGRAREAWRELIARDKELRTRPTELRRELLALRQRFPGSEEARMAMEYGIRLPSPLDQLAARPEDSDAPNFVSAVLGDVKLRHWNWIAAVASFGDGNVVAATDDQVIRLWDTTSGKALKTLTGHRGGLTALVFAGDGKTLVSGSWDGTAKIWNLETGKERTLNLNRGHVRSLALDSKEGVLAVGTHHGEITLCDLKDGKERGVCKGHGGPVIALNFSRDGKFLLSGSEDKTARRWLVSDASEKCKFEGFPHPVRALAFSPDGKGVALAGGDTIKICDAHHRNEWASFKGNHGGVQSLDFQNGRTLIAGYQHGHLKWWDLHDKKDVGEAHIHHGGLNDMILVAGGKRLVTAGNDGTLRLVDTEARKPTGVGPSSRVAFVSFAPDGSLLASADGWRSAQLWNLSSAKSLCRVQTGQLRGLCFAADGSSFSALGLDSVNSWFTDSHKEKIAWRAGERDVTTLVKAPTGDKVAIGLKTGAVVLRDPLGGRLIGTLTGLGPHVTVMVFSADGDTLYAGDEKGNLLAWDLTSGKRVNAAAHKGPIRYLALDFEGKQLVSAGDDRAVRAWDAGVLVARQIIAENREVTGLAFAPHGRALAIAAKQKLFLHKLPTGEELRAWDFPGPIDDVAYAPDGRHLATANPNGSVWIVFLPPPFQK